MQEDTKITSIRKDGPSSLVRFPEQALGANSPAIPQHPEEAPLPSAFTSPGSQITGSQDPKILVTPGSQGPRGSLTSRSSDTLRISGSQRQLDSEEF